MATSARQTLPHCFRRDTSLEINTMILCVKHGMDSTLGIARGVLRRRHVILIENFAGYKREL